MDSMASIGNTIMISSVVYLIFGILSVQLFNGKLYACDSGEGVYNGTSVTVVTQADCALIGGSWDNQTYNYDNLLNALLTLFYVSRCRFHAIFTPKHAVLTPFNAVLTPSEWH
jgi:tetrahydromethanopterin S-methyltransferase subunit C